MNKKKTHVLAFAVMSQAANLFEDWEQTTELFEDLAEEDYEEARQIVARWMNKLPGDHWDIRLPHPG